MKTIMISLGLLCLLGCESGVRSSQHPRPDPFARAPENVARAPEPAFLPAAAALVYTPPMAVDESELYLSRENRGVYATGGEEFTIIDTTYVYQDDRQRFDRHGEWGRFERRAVSTTVTVRRR